MRPEPATIFLCGDVMTGRGIDQILPHPSDPRLYEGFITDARDYVALAEEANGPIPRSVAPEYIWGDALEELQRTRPDVRLINLETSVTRSDDREPKGINYRMHPKNIGCLTAAHIDIAVLANNHVLDWGGDGLLETLATVTGAGIRIAGAGEDLTAARRPAYVELERAGRLVVFAFGSPTSGVPLHWAATAETPGVDVVEHLTAGAAAEIGARVRAAKRRGDLAVGSIHWGGNWGFDVPDSFVRFAHWLIDEGVDVVHGHSSHHIRPIEVYRKKLILYGCGDFLNDYEGIGGYEEFRNDLTLMYFVTLDPNSGELMQLRMVPMQIRKLSLHRPPDADIGWFERTIARTSASFGSSVHRAPGGALLLRWGN